MTLNTAEYREENIGTNAYGLVWSGDFMPMLGDVVGTGSWGNAKVTGYFTENGYLGVELEPLDPPQWWVEQMLRGGHSTKELLLFGIEIKKLG